METYLIKINDASIMSTAYNEYSALKKLNIFGECEMLDVCRAGEINIPAEYSFRWIYKVETVNGIALAYIKRVQD